MNRRRMVKSFGKNPETQESLYAKLKAAEWMRALCEKGMAPSSDFFECLAWICGTLEPLVRSLEQETRNLRTKAGRAAHEAVREMLGESPQFLKNHCDDLLNDHPCLCPYMAEALPSLFDERRKELEQALAEGGAKGAEEVAPERFLSARRALEEIFGLDEESVKLCEAVFLLRSYSPIENYFEDHLELFKLGGERIFAHILGMRTEQLSRRVRELRGFGFFENYADTLCLVDALLAFWSPEGLDLSALFCRPLEGETLPLSAFRLSAEKVQHMRRLLERKSEEPVHILLYGPSGTGKTTFARSLAKACKVKAWSVTSREKDDEDHRRASLSACLHMASKHEGSFVVVDEAERLLDTEFLFERRTKDKAWLNDFLEKPGQRVVWISNQVEHIDPAVRRRFTYSLYFEALGLRERVEVWRQVLKRQKLSRYFQEERMTELARNYPVEAAVIQKAVAQAHSLYPAQGFHPALERILEAHLTLQHGGETRMKKKFSAAKDFTLEGVCMEGSARSLVERCRRVDKALRSGQDMPGYGTMLFYGPPGTGKTALARYLAQELNRECLVKRASDLLSPYVGVAEQQVAAVFREAEKSGAVLVIDEADTFLYSRSDAHHSWERSLVNEFLTALEECRGFCICTTNRRDQLDAASMRRFSHKVEFRYANKAQVQALYNALLAPLCEEKLPDALRQRLLAMNRLAPGSFHAVRAQFDPIFTGPKDVTHEILLAALEQESELNLDPVQRPIGFTRARVMRDPLD